MASSIAITNYTGMASYQVTLVWLPLVWEITAINPMTAFPVN